MRAQPKLLITLAVGLVGAGSFVLTAQTTGAEQAYPMVYEQASDRFDLATYQVFIDRGDGQGPTVLTQGWGPVLSPDRQLVAFIRILGALWVIGVDGQGEHLVLSREAYSAYMGWDFVSQRSLTQVDWAPDGATLLCSYCSGLGPCDLMAVSPDGNDLRRLAPSKQATNAWPSIFSPDGQRLLLGANADVSPVLYVLNLADLSMTLITRRADTGSWSPDGSMVAFTEWCCFGHAGPGDVFPVGGHGQLGVVSVDGQPLYDVGAAVRKATGRSFSPEGLVTWSADGTELAVLNAEDHQFYAMHLDGRGLRPVASLFEPYGYTTPTSVESASWGEVKAGTR